MYLKLSKCNYCFLIHLTISYISATLLFVYLVSVSSVFCDILKNILSPIIEYLYPLQCSCLENPRDGGACWAAVYGVAQSRTELK